MDEKKEEEKKLTKKEELEEREKLIAKEEELQKREEELTAKRALGGRSEAGMEPVKPKVLTDTEYAEALERGEVNPLKEDGFI